MLASNLSGSCNFSINFRLWETTWWVKSFLIILMHPICICSSLQFLVYDDFILIGEWKPKKSYCVIKSFSVQVFILWTVLCIPGNVVTTYLYHTSNNNSTTTLEESVENISSLKCHEQKSNWNHTLSATRFALEGSTHIN